MPGTNDFLAFATGANANVESQAAWVNDPIVPSGFVSGLAQSAQANKAIRQATYGVAQLATVMAGILNQNIQDNATATTFQSQLIETMLSAPYLIDAGGTNALAVPAPAGVSGFPSFAALPNGFMINVLPANTTTIAAPTLSIAGGTAAPIRQADGNPMNVSAIVAGVPCFLMKYGNQWRNMSIPNWIAGSNFSNPGWIRFPGGLLIQWSGANSGNTGHNDVIAFPISFVSSVFTIQINDAAPLNGNDDHICAWSNNNLSSFYFLGKTVVAGAVGAYAATDLGFTAIGV